MMCSTVASQYGKQHSIPCLMHHFQFLTPPATHACICMAVYNTPPETVDAQVDNGTQSEVAAIYNLTSNTYTPYHVPQLAEASGHVLLPDGRGLIIGGDTLCFLPACLSAQVWIDIWMLFLADEPKVSAVMPTCLPALQAMQLVPCTCNLPSDRKHCGTFCKILHLGYMSCTCNRRQAQTTCNVINSTT